ncbi:helix-turn-helix domain protein [Halalkalicoccus paucihalophilus]|uniref:Helix-turn-helix domain protein n=1 Tax=Halalkalicoccus paucihalophilus TaxID=1008153 RepID=A0A151AE25_9EURY|nr:helix-turn-helix domain-containing protein [Halalkalicoccus paucihalophilus]KYH25607.1 helix-turn-helix domain protein [Halalkalicoccus paucihalophilus]
MAEPTVTTPPTDTTMTENDISHRSTAPTTDTAIPTGCSDLLDALGDASARAILREGSERPVTIEDLLSVCDVSRTTIYRRVNELVDLGLLEESITFTEDNKRQRRFRTACNRITLCVGENGLEARLDSDGTVTPFEELLLDDSTLRISLSGTDVRFGIETNGGADAVDE